MANRMEAMRAKAQAMKSKAAEAGKAKQAQKSAMVDKLKSAMATRQSAKVASAPKPKAVMPARPMGGGMGSMARPMGGMGARPAMTPQVKQGLQGMSDKLRAMPMKKGGRAKK